MKHDFEQHCSEESLELYAMGQLDESKTETLEEHILICEGCQVRLDASDKYVRAMKGATSRLRQEPRTSQAGVLDVVKHWFALPAPALAAAAMALFAVGFVSTMQLRQHGAGIMTSDAPVAVSLVAERGGAIGAPANRKLDLNLDARGLTLGSTVRVELVNATGQQIQLETLPRAGESVRFHVIKPLAGGAYFVRLYGAASGDPAREFALDVQ